MTMLTCALALLFSLAACKDNMPMPVKQQTRKGPRWTVVSETEVLPGTTKLEDSFSIAFDNGIPYVASIDKDHPTNVILKKFNGKDWEPVGGAGFAISQKKLQSLRLRIFNHVPYLLVYATDTSPTVCKYEGTKWSLVSLADSSLGAISPSSPIIGGFTLGILDSGHRNNTPYIVYSDSNNLVSIQRVSSGPWQLFSRHTEAVAASGLMDIASPGDFLYLLYEKKDASPRSLLVKRFNLLSWGWENVGKPVAIGKEVDHACLALDGQTPYIVYGSSTAGALGVTRFSGSEGEKVGQDSDLDGLFPAVLVFNEQTPYVMYRGKQAGEFPLKKFDGKEWISTYTEKADDCVMGYNRFSFGFDGQGPIVVHIDQDEQGTRFVERVSRYV